MSTKLKWSIISAPFYSNLSKTELFASSPVFCAMFVLTLCSCPARRVPYFRAPLIYRTANEIHLFAPGTHQQIRAFPSISQKHKPWIRACVFVPASRFALKGYPFRAPLLCIWVPKRYSRYQPHISRTSTFLNSLAKVAFYDLYAFLFPRSCKYFGILPLIERAAAAFSATPARLGIKKESNKALLPSCKTGTLAGVARSCVSFDPKGVWLLRNLPPHSARFIIEE